MTVLLTGGAGFVGHHLLRHLLQHTDWDIAVMDRLDTSGSLHRVQEVLRELDEGDGYDQLPSSRVSFVYHDLKAPINEHAASSIGEPDIILHLAASTHVDRSIDDPMSFVMDNVVGTCNLLEYARTLKGLEQFLYFSTDEVFGPASDCVICGTDHSGPVTESTHSHMRIPEAFKEWDRYKASNPYSATKAGAEELCLSYHNTYGLPVFVTHLMNIFGERQKPEKLIPACIRAVINQKPMPIYSDPEKTRSGSRFWIHASNVADAVLFLLKQDGSKFGDKFNVVGEQEVTNLDMCLKVAEIIGKPLKYDMVDFHSSRPGHDLRYALDGTKIRTLGWEQPMTFEKSLEQTVRWTMDHPEWM